MMATLDDLRRTVRLEPPGPIERHVVRNPDDVRATGLTLVMARSRSVPSAVYLDGRRFRGEVIGRSDPWWFRVGEHPAQRPGLHVAMGEQGALPRKCWRCQRSETIVHDGGRWQPQD